MDKSIKGQAIHSIDNVFKDFSQKYKQLFSFDLTYQTTKPPLYNVWIILNKNSTKETVRTMVTKLADKNFIKKIEIDNLEQELTNKCKVRIAILPKSTLHPFINDIKTILNSSSAELVINEFLE